MNKPGTFYGVDRIEKQRIYLEKKKTLAMKTDHGVVDYNCFPEQEKRVVGNKTILLPTTNFFYDLLLITYFIH